MASKQREVVKFCRELSRRGWVIEHTGSGHYRATYTNGQFIIISSTPRCRYWLNNAERDAAKVERK